MISVMPISSIYNLYISSDKEYVRILTNILGFVPKNLSLYKLAFRHKSAGNQVKKGYKDSNERLEFLGDAILGAVVAELLFKKYPFKDEGFLTEMRSKIVNRNHLNQLSRKLGLGNLINYDNKSATRAMQQGSLLGDAFEALIGAIYLDRNYAASRKFIADRIVKPHIDIDTLEQTETNYKSKLIEWCQREGRDVTFELVSEEGEGRARLFNIRVLVDSEEFGQGQDYTKKNAEKIAAERACEVLNI